MKYKTLSNQIEVEIRATNKGKFRFKTRNSDLEFGEIFGTKQNTFNKKVYLEWQVGYDALVSEVQAGDKSTNLTKISFVGANGKKKYPYELSELVYESIRIGLISKDVINTIAKEIETYSDFIDKRTPEIEHPHTIAIHGVSFEETSIKLHALFMREPSDGSQIEIHVKQQQYASGVQPMVYFCVPITSFLGYENLIGRTSTSSEKLIYKITEKNIGVLLDLVKIFAMCSVRHNTDIKKILAVLLQQV